MEEIEDRLLDEIDIVFATHALQIYIRRLKKKYRFTYENQELVSEELYKLENDLKPEETWVAKIYLLIKKFVWDRMVFREK